ncbi:MAG: oligopeptide/dipeptide ABC transporter ATP-binding protein, partial [Bdellovibrio sp.]
LERLQTIKGMGPSLYNLPKGCRFADRCPYVQSDCRASYPSLENLRGLHKVACYHPLSVEVQKA